MAIQKKKPPKLFGNLDTLSVIFITVIYLLTVFYKK